LATGPAPEGAVTSVTLLGHPGQLGFTPDRSGLHVALPADAPCDIACVLKITGLKMNADTYTPDGNPIPR
jgi:hypothetical protein